MPEYLPGNEFRLGYFAMPAGLTFKRRNSCRDIGEGPAYNQIVGIKHRAGINERGYVEPAKAPQLRLGNLGSFGGLVSGG
jgi:hypothetical protein